MDKTQTKINDLEEQIKMLKADLGALNQEVYRNNFSGHQDFSKFSNFTTRLKVPHYDTIPIIGEPGELLEGGGKLYICSSPNKFQLVGSQS